VLRPCYPVPAAEADITCSTKRAAVKIPTPSSSATPKRWAYVITAQPATGARHGSTVSPKRHRPEGVVAGRINYVQEPDFTERTAL
jgi:hypothetical protein